MPLEIPSLTGIAVGVASLLSATVAVNVRDGELWWDWSLPLTCVVGSILGGLLAVVMTPHPDRSYRAESLRWLGATVTGLVFGPFACRVLLPKLGLPLTADAVLAVSAMLGFLAWPVMGWLYQKAPAIARRLLSNGGGP